jgi:hypothetical protein
MPALLAYLIAVGLLLGGGYGALSWLAAPEPVKVVATAKPKPPRYEAGAAATSPEANFSDARSLAINDRDRMAPDSSDRPPSSQANAEASPAGATQQARQPVDAASRASPSNPQTAPVPAAKTAKRPHVRQANSHSEKSAKKRALASRIEETRSQTFPHEQRRHQKIFGELAGGNGQTTIKLFADRLVVAGHR